MQSTGKKILGAIDKSAVALSDAMPDWVPGKMSDDDRALYSKRGALLQQGGNAEAPTRWTGMVTSGLAYAPLAAAAPIVTGVAEGTARSQMLQDAGVDKATADKAGAAEGFLQAGAQLLPMGKVLFGQGVKTLAKTGATAAAKSGVVGAVQTASSDTIASKILSDGGFEKQAQEYAPTLEKTLDGALFNAGLHVGMETSHAVAGKIANTVWPKKFTPPPS
ncbi:hypothetical protein GCM10011396_05070 [Undibacterium terreum]|uniref:Uncharacterized protein n=1 Tax=Undibacterium terreum TaxID=1224302 RepID=A0A916U774_9BURK|nr:hypothetical protein GCM10011396_05070 [Undibacterium terreum]